MKDLLSPMESMYSDGYFPNFLVDKVKNEIEGLVQFLQEGKHSEAAVQERLDVMTKAINEIQEEFWENDSEIETVARDTIAETVENVLKAFDFDIDLETALREREW
ncbi:DUF5713 family protein [Paenibacillus sp. CN-4]|uniref:DUF5713 family protein n=1 Tax=Paenibacillus nanchangensis TaxID=3348343 RepID=UPI00397A1901